MCGSGLTPTLTRFAEEAETLFFDGNKFGDEGGENAVVVLRVRGIRSVVEGVTAANDADGLGVLAIFCAATRLLLLRGE